jgi:hypothetical protein
MFLIKMHDLKVNDAARQLRIFTVTSFALLMDLNRPTGFPSFAGAGPAATPRPAPANPGRGPDV